MGRPVRVVLQSRLSSSRLPGKAMLTVAGVPMVELAARRAASRGHEVVVATSDHPDDDVITMHLRAHDQAVVRGPLDDPLRRFVDAIRDLPDSATVVRLTADNVVPDGDVVALLVEALAEDVGYVRLGGGSLPYGVSGEAFTAAALRRAERETVAPYDREHVTPFVRRTEGDRTIAPEAPASWRGLRCTVDTYDDYVRLSRVIAGLPDPLTAPWRDVCRALSEAADSLPVLAPADNPIGQGRIVLGTVQLGLAYGAANRHGMPTTQESLDLLRTAGALGVTHLDTARAYGASERRIGAALRRGLSESTGVVTKVRPLSELHEAPRADLGRLAVRESFASSTAALGTERVDALLVHRAEDWTLPGVRDEVLALREAGRTTLVGASLSRPAELLGLLADPEVGYIQLPFNLLDRRWLTREVASGLAARPDVLVTCRSTYLQGLLVAGADAAWPRNTGADPGTLVAAIDRAVAELGRRSRADLCLAYVLAQPWVTSMVVGAETPDQLRATLDLAARAPLTADEVSVVHDLVPPGSEELLDPSRWSRA